jgi:hypothetical protein
LASSSAPQQESGVTFVAIKTRQPFATLAVACPKATPH